MWVKTKITNPPLPSEVFKQLDPIIDPYVPFINMPGFRRPTSPMSLREMLARYARLGKRPENLTLDELVESFENPEP